DLPIPGCYENNTTHLNTPDATRRLAFPPGPKQHSTSQPVGLLLKAAVQAASWWYLRENSTGRVCHTAIIQSHLKCSPLGSNTTLGSNTLFCVIGMGRCLFPPAL
ncbi:hypothetical protein HispidOSU_010276, partial [Sigmodon hispidus]